MQDSEIANHTGCSKKCPKPGVPKMSQKVLLFEKSLKFDHMAELQIPCFGKKIREQSIFSGVADSVIGFKEMDLALDRAAWF